MGFSQSSTTDFFSGPILTEIQRIFAESQRLSRIQIRSVVFTVLYLSPKLDTRMNVETQGIGKVRLGLVSRGWVRLLPKKIRVEFALNQKQTMPKLRASEFLVLTMEFHSKSFRE